MSINKFNFLHTHRNNLIFCAKAQRLVYAEDFYYTHFHINKNF
jgi:hypothetical protein